MRPFHPCDAQFTWGIRETWKTRFVSWAALSQDHRVPAPLLTLGRVLGRQVPPVTPLLLPCCSSDTPVMAPPHPVFNKVQSQGCRRSPLARQLSPAEPVGSAGPLPRWACVLEGLGA